MLDDSVKFEDYLGIIKQVGEITGDWFVADHRRRSRMSGTMGKLTILILTKNNENYIKHALDSVTGLKGVRILVCDTGSTDRTVEIVREYGIRVEHLKWVDDFAAVRNEALKYVETEWVINVDSDMQVGDDFDRIWPLLETKEYDGWKIPHRFYGDLERKEVLWPGTYPCKIPKILRVDGKVRWKGRLHEYLVPVEHVGDADAPHLLCFDRAVKTPEQLEATHLLYEKIRGLM
jgi:glycosyltransferase involved in cell wall biosynthesis